MLKKTVLSLAAAVTIGVLAFSPTQASAGHGNVNFSFHVGGGGGGFGFHNRGWGGHHGYYGHGRRHCKTYFKKKWIPGHGWILKKKRRCHWHRF